MTGTAVAAWTVGIFLLARTFGSDLLHWLQRWNSGGWAVVLLVIALAVAIRLPVKLSQRNFRRRIRAALGRSMRWEFWPAWLFYIPVGVNYGCATKFFVVCSRPRFFTPSPLGT